MSMAASLLVGEGAASGNAREKIVNGSFKIKTREQADKIVELIEEFGARIPAIKSRSFISAISKCFFTPEFVYVTFCRRLRANAKSLEKTSNEAHMLNQIETIYNAKASAKIPLVFLVTENSRARGIIFGKEPKL